jgi:putative ABC transport system ATP-binding protein
MLKMENVSKTYLHRGQTVKALDDATVQIARGDFVSVVGPSGSGKSTLLLMLGGMLSPSQGRVLLEDKSLYDMPPSDRARLRRERVGFVFQTFNLIPYLSALENVQVPLFLAKMDEEAQAERAAALLQRVGLGDRIHHKPCELSVGQQQRVALARMLANDPAVILADEPTGNLDPETSRQVIGFLEEFNAEGRTIVMVTHDPRAARRAKRLLKLNNGSIISENAVDATEELPEEDDTRDAA